MSLGFHLNYRERHLRPSVCNRWAPTHESWMLIINLDIASGYFCLFNAGKKVKKSYFNKQSKILNCTSLAGWSYVFYLDWVYSSFTLLTIIKCNCNACIYSCTVFDMWYKATNIPKKHAKKRLSSAFSNSKMLSSAHFESFLNKAEQFFSVFHLFSGWKPWFWMRVFGCRTRRSPRGCWETSRWVTCFALCQRTTLPPENPAATHFIGPKNSQESCPMNTLQSECVCVCVSDGAQLKGFTNPVPICAFWSIALWRLEWKRRDTIKHPQLRRKKEKKNLHDWSAVSAVAISSDIYIYIYIYILIYMYI